MDIKSLQSLSYDNGVISIKNIPDQDTANQVYDVFLSAVLDGHIPVTKPVGFSLENTASASRATNMRFVGSGCTCESVPYIASQLGKLIVLGWDPETDGRVYQVKYPIPSKKTKDPIPVVTGPDVYLNPGSADGKNLQFMQSGVPICRVNGSSVTLKVILSESTGFKDMSYTSRTRFNNDGYIGTNLNTESTYFYLNTNFSLVDYIRILPPQSRFYNPASKTVSVNVKFNSGLTPEIFLKLWEGMFSNTKCIEWLERRLKVKKGE